MAQATSEPERDAASPPDTSPIEAARENVEAAKARATSALGLGLGQLRIQIDGARARTTERAVETISGTLIGGAGDRVTVRIGDTVTEVADGRRFSTSVPLKPGLNHVRVVAVDGRGAEVEETVSIDYTAPIRLAITEPRDGHTLTGDDPPLVVVHGTVDDAAVSSVWVVAGDRRVAVPVVGGRFRQTVPVLQPTVQVRVEAPATEGRAPGSAAVTVHAAGMTPAVAVLLDWPGDGAVPAVVTAAWRSRPDRIEGVQRVALQTAEGDARPNFFYLRNPRPGVYTFVLAYQSGAAGFVEPALYIAAGGRQVRKLSPVALNGSGRAVVARVLMPQGVLWEDEDWFTGRSANGEGVTKFRFPDGISWTERTGGAAR